MQSERDHVGVENLKKILWRTNKSNWIEEERSMPNFPPSDIIFPEQEQIILCWNKKFSVLLLVYLEYGWFGASKFFWKIHLTLQPRGDFWRPPPARLFPTTNSNDYFCFVRFRTKHPRSHCYFSRTNFSFTLIYILKNNYISISTQRGRFGLAIVWKIMLCMPPGRSTLFSRQFSRFAWANIPPRSTI